MSEQEVQELKATVARLEASIGTAVGRNADGVSVSRARRSQVFGLWIGAAGLCSLPVLGWAAVQLTGFQAGDPIVAADVNANFSALAGALDATSSAIPPVGTIVPSLLGEIHMQQLVGDSWVLADGRDVAGSAYGELTGQTTVPDLRGVFLRGANGDRADDLGNPEGDLLVGSYQADDFESHRHAGPGVSAIASGPNFGGHGVPSNETNNAYWGDYAGGLETRPRNVTVNYYVRVE